MWPWPTHTRLKKDDSCSLPRYALIATWLALTAFAPLSVNNGPTTDNYASSIAPMLYLGESRH